MSKAPRFRLYMAISLDGFIASPDGGVKWLEPYDPYSVGFGEFLTGIGSVVMGRKSFEQMLSFGPWPYEGKRTVVMTRGSFPVTTPQTEISSEPVDILADRLARETTQWRCLDLRRRRDRACVPQSAPMRHAGALRGSGRHRGRDSAVRPGHAAASIAADRAKHFDSGLVCLDYDVLAAD